MKTYHPFNGTRTPYVLVCAYARSSKTGNYTCHSLEPFCKNVISAYIFSSEKSLLLFV